MSKVTVDQIESYVQTMLAALSGDRGQVEADLRRLLSMISGAIPLCAPGVQPLGLAPSRAAQMTPTAATPKPRPAPPPVDDDEPAPKAKSTRKSKGKK